MSRNTERAERRTAEINTRRQQRKKLRKNSADFDSGRRRFLKLGVGTVLGLAVTAGAIDAVRKLIESGKSDASRVVSDFVVVDEDKNGKVLGIEILDATESIPAFDPKKTTFSVQTS